MYILAFVIQLACFHTVRPAPPTNWQQFIDAATAQHGAEGRRAAEFLANHRPTCDADLTPRLLVENLDYAYKARREFPWSAQLDESRFFNDVLPYSVLDEAREVWRPQLYETCREIVRECRSATEAAQALNRELFNAIRVHYHTGRKKPNQSPSESIQQGRATCTGLSIILVDACRSVGIAARVAGVASWTNKEGNHTWVEIWDGDWHFMGADESDASGLDRGWFVADASKAVAGDPTHAVWATSWKITGEYFPLAWHPDDECVPGLDVTARYAGQQVSGTPESAACHIRVWAKNGGERMQTEVSLVDSDGKATATVTTHGGHADLNDMPSISLPLEKEARLEVSGRLVGTRVAIVRPKRGDQTFDLYWDQLGLTPEEAEAQVRIEFERRAGQIAQDQESELDNHAIRWRDRTLKLLEKTFGDVPPGGHSMWISMHGGGGAPVEVNDQQWHNQIKLYKLDEGIYVAPRAPTNDWNLWHQDHIDPLFDRLIETYVAARGVNPDRVYLLGYSAGGDGVYQLAPRKADRFAAAAMMAGHPNDASPLGLRNLPFAIFAGGEDAAYDRNKVAKQWGDKLDELQKQDPGGYVHRTTIYPGLGHWMNGRDAEAIPWMARHTRNSWPKRIVWHEDDVTHTRFYWLRIRDEDAKTGTTMVAEVKGQTIEILSKEVSAVTIRLRDGLLDLDRPLVVSANGREVFRGTVLRTESAIAHTLDERNDAPAAATAEVTVTW